MPTVLLMALHWLVMVAQEVAHWSAIAPLVACALMTRRRQPVEPLLWLVAAAFGVSFIADQVALRFAARGMDNLWLSHWWAPAQFGLLLAVLSPTRAVRALALGSLGLVALIPLLAPAPSSADVAVQVVGGVGAAFLAWGGSRAIRGPVMVYGLLTLPGLLVFLSTPPASVGWWVGWSAYQGARIVALLWMVQAILRPERRKEVADGTAGDSALDRRRVADWRPGLHRREPVAQAQRR